MQTKDALKRSAFVEASRLVVEAMELVQKEYDWTYRTDPDLRFMREYLTSLNEAIGAMRNVVPSERRELVLTVVTDIESLVTKIDHLTRGMQLRSSPDKYLDQLEINHRRRVYTGDD